MELRPYQKRCLLDIKKELSTTKKTKTIVVQPCGAGKSIIIAETAKMTDKPVLVIQPSKELLTQNYNKYISNGSKASIYSASKNIKEIGHVTYATPGSIKNETEKFKKLGVELILIDEAHHSTRKGGVIDEIIKKIDPKKVIGFTATPCNQDTTMMGGTQIKMMNRFQKSIMEEIIHVTQVKELVEQGFWSKVKLKQVEFNGSKLRLNTTGTDFTLKSIVKSLEDNQTDDKIISTYNELVKKGRKKILIFVATIDQAEKIAKETESIEVVHSKTKQKDRDRIISDFLDGKIKGLINVDVLSVGFDSPEIDGIIIGRPTRSYTVYYQIYGRAVRTHPNKKDCIVVDMVGNYDRFGSPEELSIENYPEWGWAMFFKDYLLTGIDLSNKSFITKSDINIIIQKRKDKKKAEKQKQEPDYWDNPKLWFGKYRGERIRKIPANYLNWLITNESFSWFGKPEEVEKTKQAIKMLLVDATEV